MHWRIYDSAVTYSIAALLWEGMAVLSLLHDHAFTALLGHLLCAASLGCAAARGEPRRRRSAGTIAVWTLFMPVLAPLGLCVVVLPALRRVHAYHSDTVLEIQRARPKLTTERRAQSLSLRELLREMADDPSQRTAALMSLRHTELSRAVPLLRAALLDTDEDLRLLAYALLEHREKQVRARIEAGKAELALQVACQVALQRLCADHWLLVQAGFVSGDTLAETLAAALDYGERALTLHNDGALHVLLARICLHAEEAERALDHLAHAERLGTARSVLSPLFAHAVFLQGRYAHVPSLLRMSTAASVARPEQRGLWTGPDLV